MIYSHQLGYHSMFGVKYRRTSNMEYLSKIYVLLLKNIAISIPSRLIWSLIIKRTSPMKQTSTYNKVYFEHWNSSINAILLLKTILFVFYVQKKTWYIWNIFSLKQDVTNDIYGGIKISYKSISEIEKFNKFLHTYIWNLPNLVESKYWIAW